MVCYIGFYDTDDFKNENRDFSLAGRNKMDYIAKSIKNDVIIVSPSWAHNFGFFSARKIKLDNKIKLYICPSYFTKIKLVNKFRKYISLLWLYIFTLFNIKKKDKIIIYHSTYLLNYVKFLKKIKKIKIILEVEEVYSDISYKNKKKEYKIFALADKYIFITEMLNKKINVNNKPYCISHGTYKSENQVIEKYNDGKIHIVYSGIIDKQKKGACTSLAICKYLNEKYKLHIVGFGSQEDVNMLINEIEENNKSNECKAVFDGKLTGDEYIKYLQRCDIGLSTQDPTGEYNATSFPSKILAYLSNGLRVVSVNIPAIKTSDVGNILYYYDEDSPEKIANVIKNIDMSDEYDSRKLINKLDKHFTKELNNILEGD